MRNNFIGPDELAFIADKMGILVPQTYPIIQFSPKELDEKSEDYILILGLTKMKDGLPLTITTLRNYFGVDPKISEPCFYNQDWYVKEDFVNITLVQKWYLLRKKVFEKSRAIQPEKLLKTDINFPSAILCAYTFFAYYFVNMEYLWSYDYIWCNDMDHSGDRIYVGRYIDIEGINKNGFSIHRHLSLRKCYGAINNIVE